jgi:glucuronate isomerase
VPAAQAGGIGRSESGLNFIHENFLLQSETSRRLYFEYAESQPILDFHSHLPVADIASNRQFEDLFEIWLEGDHYKWRAMRASGVPERYCTGDASHYEKYLAWARTVPSTLRNPLYQWTHLELVRYFRIHELLNADTADAIWRDANRQLRESRLGTQGILRNFRILAVCTTNDPTETLDHHRFINASNLGFRVCPTFRPDEALALERPDLFNEWVDRLALVCGKTISTLGAFLQALEERHSYFHQQGCRLSDHGLPYCYASPCSELRAAETFMKVRSGVVVSPEEHHKFASFMMLFFGHLDAKRGWTKQLHIGALRNANLRLLREVGPNTGFDSIGDWPQACSLNAYLSQLEEEHCLPRMIIYNNNPADNLVFATTAGNFQDSGVAGKIQFGGGWWFLDQKEGIEWQLNALSNVGLLSTFVGMVTDSRSFLSFPRHEYFRRVLCNLLGREMEYGELPNDEKLIGSMIRRICFENAREHLRIDLGSGLLAATST